MSNYLDNKTNAERAELLANDLFKSRDKKIKKFPPKLNLLNISIEYDLQEPKAFEKVVQFIDDLEKLKSSKYKELSTIVHLKKKQ